MTTNRFKEALRYIQSQIEGSVYTDTFTRYLYSTDASSYQIMPEGVIVPKTEADVQTVIRIASQNGIPVIPRGGGSSLSGQGIGPGVVLDFTVHLNNIISIDPHNQYATVQSGVVLNQLNKEAARYGLMVGPDPSSASVATLGGMTANNSTGSHSIMYGMMVDNVVEVQVVLADGTIATFSPRSLKPVNKKSSSMTLEEQLYQRIPELVRQYADEIETHYPRTWRNVAGYNINRILQQLNAGNQINLAPLIVGSEGTLAAILTVTLKLVPKPKSTGLALLHFHSIREALSTVPRILEFHPAAVELLDAYFIDLTRKNAEYRSRLTFLDGNPAAVLIVEYAGNNSKQVNDSIDTFVQGMRRGGFTGPVVLQLEPEEVANVWEVRKAGLGLLLSKRGDAKPLAFIDDVAVPVENLAQYADGVMEICRKYGTEAAFYAHASAGCLHINPVINLKTPKGVNQLKHISQEAIALGISLGGTSTGEHGEGLARSYYNEQVYGKKLHQAFRQLKHLFDPQNIMNPGKIVEKPLPWDETLLRFNPSYRTPLAIVETYQDFSRDGGFAGLVEMCNGQGYCRNRVTGIMCPSFRVTQNEAFSTRGRANGLRAAMTGELGPDGLFNHQLKEALDLCLACKACKVECPSLVDMTKLKAEYLAHYYQQKGTPLAATVFGNIDKLNRVARIIPGVSNRILNARIVRKLMENYLGIDRRRSLPPVATTSFGCWFRKRPRKINGKGKLVVLWDDTFTVTHEPHIAQAAVEVLEAVGYEVLLIPNKKCCGRPRYSKGLLSQVKKDARTNLELLQPYLEKQIPVIVLEPSCLTMFREEYPDLVPSSAARKLARLAFGIEEFLVQLHEEHHVPFPWPKEKRNLTIGVHVHCHQHSLGLRQKQIQMLSLIPGARVFELSDATCCGMAGAFGYEKNHFEISMKIGEEKLFPAIRQTSTDTHIVAAGTSCRHQIKDGTRRQALHPIIVFAKALLGDQFKPMA